MRALPSLAAPLALVAALALGAAPAAARLPRGFSQAAFCSACRAVAAEFHAAYAAADEHATVPTGSYRLNEEGKQIGRLTIPLRQSATHATHVLDATCTAIAERYMIYPRIAPDVFVAAADIDARDARANATADARAVRSLPAVCSRMLDEHYDELVALVQAGPLAAEAWGGEAEALCAEGRGGVVSACGETAVRLAGDVLDEAVAQREADDKHKALVSAEREAEAKGNETEADASGEAGAGTLPEDGSADASVAGDATVNTRVDSKLKDEL